MKMKSISITNPPRNMGMENTCKPSGLGRMVLVFLLYLVMSKMNVVYASECQVPVTLNINVSGAYSVQRDAPVGTIITPWYSAEAYPYTTCQFSSSEPLMTEAVAAISTPLNQTVSTDGLEFKIYKTNVDGIGFIIKSSGRESYTDGGWDSSWQGMVAEPDSTSFSGISAGYTINKGRSYTTGLKVEVAFVKYMESKSGAINGGTIAQGMSTYYSDFTQPSAPIVMMSSLVVNTLACSILTPTLTFPLGNIPVSEFGTTVGFTPAETSTQNLGLNCDAGANINVQLNATQNPDASATSVLALDNQGSSGVSGGLGVQLLYNGSPLEIGKNMVLKQSAGGQETFPITARYYQTKTTVTPGDASTSATLSLTYQ
ncbi:fimbrial protein [Enterobacter sp. 22452]|uniref:fimbrial protein n=1 Tax=Enterobacter TaxID=547 RepID=UPI003F843BD1